MHRFGAVLKDKPKRGPVDERRDTRIVHAWPDNGIVSLCGRVRNPDGPINGSGHKCAKCLREATRKDFSAR